MSLNNEGREGTVELSAKAIRVNDDDAAQMKTDTQTHLLARNLVRIIDS